MRKLKISLLSAFILFAIAGCKKTTPDLPVSQLRVNSAKVSKLPTTPEEKKLVENLGKITEVLKELYTDNSNLKVVNAAVFSRTYKDETVPVKDLIYPETSLLPLSDKFISYTKKWNVSLNKFAEAFWQKAKKTNDTEFIHFLESLNYSLQTANNEPGNGNGPTIYFPYSEEYLPEGGGTVTYAPITSVATATADADEGIGDMPLFVNGVFQNYIQVLVNDDFCFANPTQIVGINGIEIEPEPNGPPPPPPPPPGISRVYVGEGACKKQYDRLISFTGNGGGSEIKYCHLTGYLQPVNGQVTTFQDIVSVGFSRYTIRNKNWVNVTAVWDDDWVPGDLEQVFGIYEEDNTNTKTFTGSLGTTVTVVPGSTITGTIGFSITVTSQDEIIRQLKISRNSYFTASFADQGWGFANYATFLPLPFTHGWPRYDNNEGMSGGAEVAWLWPYNTL
jgi:hypothetical protein